MPGRVRRRATSCRRVSPRPFPGLPTPCSGWGDRGTGGYIVSRATARPRERSVVLFLVRLGDVLTPVVPAEEDAITLVDLAGERRRAVAGPEPLLEGVRVDVVEVAQPSVAAHLGRHRRGRVTRVEQRLGHDVLVREHHRVLLAL